MNKKQWLNRDFNFNCKRLWYTGQVRLQRLTAPKNRLASGHHSSLQKTWTFVSSTALPLTDSDSIPFISMRGSLHCYCCYYHYHCGYCCFYTSFQTDQARGSMTLPVKSACGYPSTMFSIPQTLRERERECNIFTETHAVKKSTYNPQKGTDVIYHHGQGTDAFFSMENTIWRATHTYSSSPFTM